MPQARLRDVAERAGVSIKTVSNVVNDRPYVREETRAKVMAAVEELRYRPNAMGRQLRRGRTGLVSLAVPELDHPYFAELVRHVVDAAAATGTTVLAQQTDGELDNERATIDGPETGVIDGLIFSPLRMPVEELDARHANLPMVLLGESPPPESIDHVGIDNTAAAADVVTHLVASGRRRITILARENGPHSTSELRISGAEAAAGEHGLALDKALTPTVDGFSRREGHRAMTELLQHTRDFDAVMCASDALAIGAIRALHDAGVAIPDDVAVVGWDNVDEAAYTFPSLTTIDPGVGAIARTALDLLQQRMAAPNAPGHHRLLPHRLQIRNSSR